MKIIYKSKRIGKGGKPFYLYKFRTMCEGADQMGGPSTAGDDKRITKNGRWLRKYKIDEIPTIFNFIKGDLVLIGSRPDVPEVINLMTDYEYDIILSRKPGLIGLDVLADFHEEDNLSGQANPHQYYLDIIWPVKKKLQIYYIKNRSFKLNLMIFVFGHS